MKLKFYEFPLEIKLMIYEFYDPKDRRVVIDKNYSQSKNIYIQSENTEWFSINLRNYFLNYSIYFMNRESSYFNRLKYTTQYFYLRKSQVEKCFERLK